MRRERERGGGGGRGGEGREENGLLMVCGQTFGVVIVFVMDAMKEPETEGIIDKEGEGGGGGGRGGGRGGRGERWSPMAS